ncbi:MAG TPA: hypothetical protein VHB25_02340 [Gemmatimonadaceae bacterium]|nr:hypothetical protein [Gemmatimonadaceae bacterium]
MFAGHAALALGAKGARPRIPIALLVPVAFAPDWIEWICNLAGWESRLASHSLVSVAIGATLVALAYAAVTGAGIDAIVLGLTYVSHWGADFITGSKPTWPGGPSVGLMLYAHPLRDAMLEGALIIACWLIYRRSLSPEARRRAAGRLIPLGLIAMQIAFVAMQNPSLVL